MAGGDESVVEVLRDLRAELPETNRELATKLQRGDFDAELISRLANLLTVEPVLWRLDAVVTDEYGSRRYQILMEYEGNRTITHSCRMTPMTEEDRRSSRR